MAHQHLHVSPWGLEHIAFDWIHHQDGGLLNGAEGVLLVNRIIVKRAAKEKQSISASIETIP